jgi:hypothetical protein
MGPLEREFRMIFEASTGFGVDDPKADPRKLRNSRQTFMAGAFALHQLITLGDDDSERLFELRRNIDAEMDEFIRGLGDEARSN